MIGLVVRVILLAAAVVAAVAVVGLLVDSDGVVTLRVMDVEYPPLTLFEAALLLLLFSVAAFVFYKAAGLTLATLRFLLGDETALSRFRMRAKEARGLDALSQGMVALAEGDARAADQHARRATRLLGKRALTQLLSAQAADALGDSARAREHYRALAREPETGMVGVKGLLAQAVKRGETARAAKLAAHAFAMRPRDPEIQTMLFELQVREGAWEGARATLGAMKKTKTLPADVAARRQAVLDLEAAKAAAEAGDRAVALRCADAAVRAAADLAPAAAYAATLHAEEGETKKAARILKEAWRANPNPDIAFAFAALAPEESPAERRRRFEELLAANRDDPESRMLAAELAIADHDWHGARRALGDLAETGPTHRSLAIMAAIEKGEGAAESVVRGYLARAVTAPRGGHWTCERCAAAPGGWSAVCPGCGAFDSMTWRAGSAVAAEAMDDAMLPLLVASDPEPEPEREPGSAEEDRLDAEAAAEAEREAEPAGARR
jgi:HemY protein